MAPPGKADQDDEVEEARWIALSKAQTALSYETERAMVQRTSWRLEALGRLVAANN